MTKTTTKKYFDLLILATLEEELHQFFEVFPHENDYSTEDQLIFTVNTGHQHLTAIFAQVPEMGKQPAYQATQYLLNQFDVGLVACIGIAGGLSDDLRLGDVCYTGNIIDVNERTRVKDDSTGVGLKLEFSPTYYSTPRSITSALNFVRTNPNLKSRHLAWQQNCRDIAIDSIPTKHSGVLSEYFNSSRHPTSWNGTLVCGVVSKSEEYNNYLKSIDRKVLSIDTESGGVFQAALENRNVPAITIRGISDYADANKNKLEQDTSGRFREIAAYNAALFLKMQLENPFVVNFFTKQRNLLREGEVEDLFPDEEELKDIVSSTLDRLFEEIDENLRELSPEYRLQIKGYQLPAPRIKPIEYEDDPRYEEGVKYKEIVGALNDHNSIVVDLPRSYPDQSLPWIFADHLSLSEIDDKRLIPLVIDGSSVRPPKFSFVSALPSYDLPALISEKNRAQLVFIISNIPLQSRSRRNFFIKQLREFPEAKFVFITRDEGRLLVDNQLIKAAGARIYDISEISFLSISEFIQKNFGMVPSEAEVIALRLKNTFQKFDLSAHPTYFAGIPRETLSALLQANQRAELMQLAVDGFLTFVVAGDVADISLSRTTRARFLSNLAVELDIEKRVFSRSSLIEFIEEFAQKYDFEIEPIIFVTSFLDNGILRFYDDNVSFTLPFIKTYLLALALSKDSVLATRHFNFDEDEFDIATFDVYVELGASEEIIEEVQKRLETQINNMKKKFVGENILLSATLRPAFLSKYNKIQQTRKRLQSAIKKLHNKNDDGAQKQRLLDIADSVSERAQKETIGKIDLESGENNAEEKQLDLAGRDWVIGSVMLGAAAEQLLGVTKQKMAGSLVTLANLIIDRSTRELAEVDFAKVKADVLASQVVKEFLAQQDTDKDKREWRKRLSELCDLLELSILADPLRRILDHLCEQSRHKVLAQSVEKASVPEGIDPHFPNEPLIL